LTHILVLLRYGMKPKKIPISHRALIQRINRALDKRGQQLCKWRKDIRGYAAYGDYQIVDLKRGGMVETNVNLEKLARKIGALNAWEAVSKA
jgi:hypothetical protein